MTKHLLDLRKKGMEQVRIILKPRSFREEMIKMFSVIIIVTAIGFGISYADDLNPFSDNGIETATEDFSAAGIISEIKENSISLQEATVSDGSNKITYDLNIKNLEKIETNQYVPLNITDLNIGDKIIARGLTNGDSYYITRIISFSSEKSLPIEVATTTATTTIDTASSTDENASTTDETTNTTDDTEGDSNELIETASTTEDIATTTATTTDETAYTTMEQILETVSDTVDVVVDAIVDTVENVVDAATGNDDNTNSTEEITTEPATEEPQQEEPTPELIQ